MNYFQRKIRRKEENMQTPLAIDIPPHQSHGAGKIQGSSANFKRRPRRFAKLTQIKRASATLVKASSHRARRAPTSLPPGFVRIHWGQTSTPGKYIKNICQRYYSHQPATKMCPRKSPGSKGWWCCDRERRGRRERGKHR